MIEELVSASYDGAPDRVIAAIAEGVDVNGVNNLQETALCKAVRSPYANPIVVTALLDANANVNRQDRFHAPPIVMAADNTCIKSDIRYEIVNMLVVHGANVNGVCHNNFSALHYAITNGDVKLAEFLLEQGADPNSQDAFGDTAAMNAVNLLFRQKCNLSTLDSLLKSLLAAGADVNLENKGTWTPLSTAAIINEPLLTKKLLAAGADVMHTGSEGNTPLHIAAMYGSADAYRQLIRAGADVNAKNVKGDTSLLIAITTKCNALNDPEKRMNMVRLATWVGTDVNIRNNAGRCALDLLCRSRCPIEVANMLCAHGACVNILVKRIPLVHDSKYKSLALRYGARPVSTAEYFESFKRLPKYCDLPDDENWYKEKPEDQ